MAAVVSCIPPPHIVEDFIGLIQLLSDGSVVRSDESAFFPMKEAVDDGTAVWKDCLFDRTHNLHLRLYKPAHRSSPSATCKLPVLFYFRGGGFLFGSRTWPHIHTCCLRLASVLKVLVVAPEYRCAPEHRIPAPMNDAMSSLKWLQSQALLGDGADEWLHGGEVDFDRVFVMGDSSGGNMAHHLAVDLRRGSPELAPVCVRGYVLMSPFFGGTLRTKSEAEPRPLIPMNNIDDFDKLWKLSLPVGMTRDHPWANPFGPSSPELDSVELDPMLVMAGGDEVMKDRIQDYYKRLKAKNKEIEYVEFEGEPHGVLTFQTFSESADKALQHIKQFIFRNNNF